MIVGKRFRTCAAGAAASLAFMFAGASAQAQSIFFDWGSNEKVNDSGREIVSFEDKVRPGELIVSFGDRRVFYVIAPGKALSYPIAVPREKSKWAGTTSVSQKRVSPSWTPTPEMIAENPRLPPWVPGGHPMNPLGTHALYLGSSLYRIHGTDAPWTIGTAASKGCVRMYNKDVQDLFPRVPVGTKVTVTYQTYKFGALDGESAKGILASLDKGKKIKVTDDVAAASEQATKKWRGDDSDADAPPVHKAAASDDDDKATDEPSVSPRKWSDKRSTDRDDESKKSVNATADMDGKAEDEALAAAERRKQRNQNRDAVETGSVDKDKLKATTKERVEAKDKQDSQPRKQAAHEDATAIANRALAAAERAAAAAERAADAAERASAAAIKATAKSEGEPQKSSEQMSSWPVVKSAKADEPSAMTGWPVVKSGSP